MNTQEVINTVQQLPLIEQQRILQALQKSLSGQQLVISEDEIERTLLAQGLISEIPPRLPNDDEELYEPVEIAGKPLSETILEGRE